MSLRIAEPSQRLGAAWAGPVPAEWRIGSISRIAQVYAGGTPDRETPSYWEDGSIPWLSSGEVNQGTIRTPTTYITEAGFRSSSAKWIPKGALVIALAGQGKTKGMVAQLAIACTCNQSMAAIVPSSLVESRFLFWWLTAHYRTIRNLAGGELRDGLNMDIIRGIPCPLPPRSVQRAIADALDRETARIDALIAVKRRMVELLEQRVRLEADQLLEDLTPWRPLRRGLLPKRDSLIAGPFGSDLAGTDLLQSGPCAVVDQEVVISGDFTRAKHFISSEKATNLQRFAVRPDDILISGRGSIGATTLVPTGFGAGVIHPSLLRIRPDPRRLDPTFLTACFRWSFRISDYFRLQSTATTIAVIYGETLRGTPVPMPELSDQRRVLSQIETLTAQWEAAQALIGSQLALLRERREAIITAAVTGQVDILVAA